MVKTSEIYHILSTQFEESKARAVTDAIVQAVETSTEKQESDLRVYIKENCASKADLFSFEARLVKWVFGFLVSQTIITLGAVHFMLSHAK